MTLKNELSLIDEYSNSVALDFKTLFAFESLKTETYANCNRIVRITFIKSQTIDLIIIKSQKCLSFAKLFITSIA